MCGPLGPSTNSALHPPLQRQESHGREGKPRAAVGPCARTSCRGLATRTVRLFRKSHYSPSPCMFKTKNRIGISKANP